MNIEQKHDPSPQQHHLNERPPDSETRRVPLDKLLIDGGTQARAALDQEAVDHYADLMAEKGSLILPPIRVFEEPGVGFWVGDGFHRIAAAATAGFMDIPAVVWQGTRLDALIYSLKSNHTHGVRRTNADKRRSVKLAFSEETLRGGSDRAIAELCGVGNQFVGNVRRILKLDSTGQLCDSHSSSPAKRKGLDGKMRPAVGHRRGKKTRPPVETNGEAHPSAEPTNSAMPAFPNGSGKQSGVEDEPSLADGNHPGQPNNADNEALGEMPRTQVNVLSDRKAAPSVAGEDAPSTKEQGTPAIADHEGFLLVDGTQLTPTQWDDGPVPLVWTQGEIEKLKRNNNQLATEKQRDIVTLQAEQICLVELARTANRLLATLEGVSEPPMAILNSAVFQLRNYTATRSLRVSNPHENEGVRR